MVAGGRTFSGDLVSIFQFIIFADNCLSNKLKNSDPRWSPCLPPYPRLTISKLCRIMKLTKLLVQKALRYVWLRYLGRKKVYFPSATRFFSWNYFSCWLFSYCELRSTSCGLYRIRNVHIFGLEPIIKYFFFKMSKWHRKITLLNSESLDMAVWTNNRNVISFRDFACFFFYVYNTSS